MFFESNKSDRMAARGGEGSKGSEGGSKGRHWANKEVHLLLDVVEDVLPGPGRKDWARVATSYNAKRMADMPERDDEQVKNKFKALRNAKNPIGDAIIPPAVRRAKLINEEIKKSMITMGNDIEDDEGAEDNFPSDNGAEEVIGCDGGAIDAEEKEEEEGKREDVVSQQQGEFDQQPNQQQPQFISSPQAVSLNSSAPNMGNSNRESAIVRNRSNKRSFSISSMSTSTASASPQQYETTERTGYPEDELFSMSSMRHSSNSIPMNEVTRKRRKLDGLIEDIRAQARDGRESLAAMLLYMREEDRRLDEERTRRWEEEHRRYKEQRAEEFRRYEELRTEERRRYEEQLAQERKSSEDRHYMMTIFFMTILLKKDG